MKICQTAVVGLVLLLGLPVAAAPQAPPTTQVMVRVIAHDAKIIGSGVGGARITIVKVSTGDTLATGVQQGGTGDTQRIMVAPRNRGVSLFDTEGAAGYTARLSVDEPTVVQIIAEGPLDTPHARQRATKTLLVVPGQDVLGDGVIMELHGYTVKLDVPNIVNAGETFEIQANVTMLCGCPTEPNGLWDANQMEIVAYAIGADGQVIKKTTLGFAGTTSNYSATVALERKGPITLRVVAMHPTAANFGMAVARLTVN